MWKLRQATNLLTRFTLALAFTAIFLHTTRALSDKRLCADEKCKETISLGVGVITYRAGEEGMVSFKINSKIRIKSKGAGSNPQLWGIEVNGREGYAPSNYIRETQVLVSQNNLNYTVDVVPINAGPILTTSEKLVEQENTIDSTTTKPLNLTPVESTEQSLKVNTEEKLITESAPVATPVMTEVVDGTPIPIISNESEDFTNSLPESVATENKIEKVTEIDNKPVENGKMNENVENSKDVSTEDIKSNEFQISASSEGVLLNKEKNSESFSLERDKEVIKNDGDSKEDKNAEILNESSEKVTTNNVLNNLEINEDVKVKSESNDKGDINPTENAEYTENTETKPALQSTEYVTETTEKSEYLSVESLLETNQQIQSNNSSNLKSSGNNENRGSNVTENNNSANSVKDTFIIAKEKEFSTSDKTFSQPLTDPNDQITPQTEINADQQMEVNTVNILPAGTDDLKEKLSLSEPVANSIVAKEPILDKTSTTPELLAKEEAVKETIYQKPHSDQSETETEVEVNEIQSSHETKENTSGGGKDTLEIDTSISGDKSLDSMEEKIDPALSSNADNSNEEYKTQTATDGEIGTSTEASNPSPTSDGQYTTPSDSLLQTEEVGLYTIPKIPEEILTQDNIRVETVNPTTYSPNNEANLNTPPLNQYYPDNIYQELPTTNIPLTDTYDQKSSHPAENLHSTDKQADHGVTAVPTIPIKTVSPLVVSTEDEQPNTLPSSTPFPFDSFEANKENKGLFATIMGTVNNMLSINRKNKNSESNDEMGELDRMLFSKNEKKYTHEEINQGADSLLYCKNIGPNGDCPETEENHETSSAHSHQAHSYSFFDTGLTLETFFQTLASKILEISDLLAFLVILTAAVLFFIFGYYCFCNSSREGALLSKLNQLESTLLATHKENSILKHNLMSTRHKLASIEDNSFGSNDMVVSLKKELEEELMEKSRLQEQITVLQKELENAADAGIELNKIVSELLSNQTGDESIISSVEELQKQLNEQQNTIFEINASLAEKSRENSELQLLIAEQNARYETELANVQRDNDELEHEKNTLLTKIEEMKIDFDKDITAALEGKNFEIKRLQNEVVELTNKLENEHTKWQTCVAKIEALEECLKNVRKDPHVNIAEVIDVANVKAQLIEAQKKYKSLKEKHETELDARKLAENQLEVVSVEVEKLKQDFNQSEKDKLEAQTRLEVLSNYFREKENQLQKELSLKEAMWLKQQGETTTTVDRVTAMQEEIQSLKSQNDSLRAEIEAQVAAHKAQTGTLENRAHETWLAARQSDRRYEEARAEATALRRKLTALAGGNINETNKSNTGPPVLGDELGQAPSPIHMESPGSPMLGRMPPPPFLPPPFMGPPPPFMGMPPPPPFVPPGEMRPAPLGRIMSPPPQRSGRFSPQHLDYDDYLDYEGNTTWHRHTYSPPPRTYRSLSPTDSRYNYGTERDLMSTYDTETDFSPPPSPRESRRRGGNSSERLDYNTKIPYGNTKKFNNKGPLSSGSEKSFNTPSHNDGRDKKGNANLGGKTLV